MKCEKYIDVYIVTDKSAEKRITDFTILSPYSWTFTDINGALTKVKDLSKRQSSIEVSIVTARILNKKFVLSEKKKELEQQLEEVKKELGE